MEGHCQTSSRTIREHGQEFLAQFQNDSKTSSPPSSKERSQTEEEVVVKDTSRVGKRHQIFSRIDDNTRVTANMSNVVQQK